MKLSDVVQYFNNTEYFDGYDGTSLGFGQLDVYDDSKRDGITAQRRVFEVNVGSPMPARGVIEFANSHWLVGVKEIDLFRGEVHREKYVCHQAEDLSTYRSIKEVLEGAEGVKAYAARVWVKTTAQVEISSEKFNQMQIFMTRAENVVPASIVSIANKHYIVSEVYPATAGHLVAMSEEMDAEAIEVGSITQTKFNPRTDEYEETDTPVNLTRLRWQSLFEYMSLGTAKFERGDIQAAMLEPLAVGTVLTLADGKWAVQAVDFKLGVHFHHLRRTR